ncbi:28609_t:CDS:2, partial [Racocetra persica]
LNPTANLTSKFNRILELANKYKPVSMHIFNDVTLNNIVVRSPIKKRKYNNKFLKAVKPLNPTIEFFRSFYQHALEPQKRNINPIMLLGEVIHNSEYECGLGDESDNNDYDNDKDLAVSNHKN